MARKIITKEELLNIASEIINDKCLKACSIRALSKKAGVAVGTIYNYFPSRDNFLEELFKKSWIATLDKLQPILQNSESIEKKLETLAFCLESDVEARKGLGKEIYGAVKFSKDMCKSHKDVFEKIIIVIKDIISQSENNRSKSSSDLILVSKWIFMILIDTIVGNERNLKDVLPELKYRFL